MPNKTLSTYTFIVHFRGGTYCSQVQAEDASKPISGWLKSIDREQPESNTWM